MEFEIINVFFKERRSKYELNTLHVVVCTKISVWSWTFGLKSWKNPGNPLVKMCKNPVRHKGAVTFYFITAT